MPFAGTMELFDQPSIEAEASRRLNRAAEKIDGTSASALDRLAESLVEECRFDVPRLFRNEAKFKTTEMGSSVQVQVTIPTEGDEVLLKWRPGREPSTRRPIRAWVTDITGRLEDGSANPRGAIRLEKIFPAGTDPDTVRDWARGQVDEIERSLTLLDQFAEGWNRGLPSQIASRVDNRRRVLGDASRLAGELGTGI